MTLIYFFPAFKIGEFHRKLDLASADKADLEAAVIVLLYVNSCLKQMPASSFR